MRLRPTVSFIIAKQSLAIERIVFIDQQKILEKVNFHIFDLLNMRVSIPISLSIKYWEFEFDYNKFSQCRFERK
jgi:hypothetical protein